MPTAKRASMREGPLSQLFRKTAQETASEASAPPVEPQDAAPAPAVAEPAERRTHPHPSLRPSVASAPAGAESAGGVGPGEPRLPGVPSPQQRLESAFAADIPASLMEPPA